MIAKKLCIILLLVSTSSALKAQDLLELLDKERPETPVYTGATFQFSRITFGHSLETRKDGTLDVLLTNRFWNSPAERSQSFFVDRLSTRIALEYGLSDRLLMGLGGTTFDGRFDGFLKYRLVRQRSDGKGAPFSISLFQNASYFSEEIAGTSLDAERSKRFSFTSQLLIAKKLTSRLSLQLSPTFVHRGLVYQEDDPQSHFVLGFSGRYKIGGHVSFVSEYYYVANPIRSFDTYGAFSLGVNWEQSDVMLQFMLTNAQNIVEDSYLTETRNNFNFKSPNLNFGFNFTYTFHLKKKLRMLK